MKNRDILRWLAIDNHGIVTTGQAQSAGVPAVEVRKLASRGALTRIGHGVYRMEEAPTTALTAYAEALALVGKGAFLADESVLAVHDLAHVNPRTIKVGTDRRVRTQLPSTIHLLRLPRLSETEYVEGLVAMPLSQALLACRGRVLSERLMDATREAQTRGLLDAQNTDLFLTQLAKDGASY